MVDDTLLEDSSLSLLDDNWAQKYQPLSFKQLLEHDPRYQQEKEAEEGQQARDLPLAQQPLLSPLTGNELSINNFDKNIFLISRLEALCSSMNFPHLILYGLPSVGKKTIAYCILHRIYGKENIKPEREIWKLEIEKQRPAKKREKDSPLIFTYRIPVWRSRFHLEIEPNDAQTMDKEALHRLIRNYAQHRNVTSSVPFKVVIIRNADRLSKYSQEALRVTMEDLAKFVRFIFCTREISKLQAPIRSRCLPIRIPALYPHQVCEILQTICVRQKVNVNPKLLQNIVLASGNNLREAITILEATFHSHCDVISTIVQPITFEWKEEIKSLAGELCTMPSMMLLMKIFHSLHGKKRVSKASNLFARLLSDMIPPVSIIKQLFFHLTERGEDQVRFRLIEITSHYEHQLHQSQRTLVTLEAMVTAIVYEYQQFLRSCEEMFET